MSSETEQKNELLYREVGRLTRALHDALKDFHLDIGLKGFSAVEQELSEIADARSRLDYVIRLTEDAANTTMDKVDEATPLVQALSSEAHNLLPEWKSVIEVQGSAAPDSVMADRVTALLGRSAENGDRLQSILAEIMIAQSYQDLSGQVIKRVISLVSDVERSLVRLIRIAGNVEDIAGISPESSVTTTQQSDSRAEDARKIRAEGPQTRAGNKEVVSGQDDVDELLSSLGF